MNGAMNGRVARFGRAERIVASCGIALVVGAAALFAMFADGDDSDVNAVAETTTTLTETTIGPEPTSTSVTTPSSAAPASTGSTATTTAPTTEAAAPTPSGDNPTDAELIGLVVGVPEGRITGNNRPQQIYEVETYLRLEEFGVHIYGSPGVHAWTLAGTYRMAEAMIGALVRQQDRDAFEGYEIFVITNDQPDIGSTPGHKNTGTRSWAVINQHIICATAVDTIRPDSAAEYRAWDTPIHEFGHGIEHGLQLESRSDETYGALDGYNPIVGREYFAWTTQSWFNADLRQAGTGYRETIPEPGRSYFASLFDEDVFWTPSCDGRP